MKPVRQGAGGPARGFEDRSSGKCQVLSEWLGEKARALKFPVPPPPPQACFQVSLGTISFILFPLFFQRTAGPFSGGTMFLFFVLF